MVYIVFVYFSYKRLIHCPVASMGVGFEQRLRWDTCTYSRPGAAGVDGSAPLERVSDGLIVVLLFGDDNGRAGGAPCELTLPHALRGGIPVDPNRPGAAMDV